MLLLAGVQLVNILDFMIVMPLGTRFAEDLDIPLSQLPTVAGAYMFAAAFSGVLGGFVLDRVERRKALGLAMFGLGLGTVACALANGIETLVLARCVAGFFGGPATALALAVLTDLVPEARRGRALGVVMTSFSVASVLGVPLALRLATWGSWHTPFWVTGALASVAGLAIFVVLPRVEPARDQQGAWRAFGALLSRGVVLRAYAMMALSFGAGFMLIPNIAPFVEGNLRYPRERLDLLYFAGGIASLITLRIFGRLVDRFGSFRVGALGAVAVSTITYVIFARGEPGMPVLPLFVVFMTANGMRNVAGSALSTKVPRPSERGRYMSLQSVIQHLGSLAGTMLAGLFLGQTEDGRLTGIDNIAWMSIGITMLVPLLLASVESRVRAEAQVRATS